MKKHFDSRQITKCIQAKYQNIMEEKTKNSDSNHLEKAGHLKNDGKKPE